jgi:hypothetical protein
MPLQTLDWSKVKVPEPDGFVPEKVGIFSGSPVTRWLTEGGPDRKMQILEDFWYDDPDDRRWLAPMYSIVDGASIPSALWSFVGSPYTGDYRRASIVHDVACDTEGVCRAEADRMYYFACLAGGCSKRDAQLQYVGVRIGAWIPNVRLWNEEVNWPPTETTSSQLSLSAVSMQTTFLEIASDIDARHYSLAFEELEEIVNGHLGAKAKQ